MFQASSQGWTGHHVNSPRLIRWEETTVVPYFPAKGWVEVLADLPEVFKM